MGHSCFHARYLLPHCLIPGLCPENTHTPCGTNRDFRRNSTISFSGSILLEDICKGDGTISELSRRDREEDLPSIIQAVSVMAAINYFLLLRRSYTGSVLCSAAAGFAMALISFFFASGSIYAQGAGDLLVTPTRVTFEGAKKNEVLTLVNRGSDTAIYELVVVQYRMMPDGRLQEIDVPDSGQLFATEQIRFFPRRVVLAPKEVQNVRVQLKSPEGVAQGEYRSHLLFRAVPRTIPASGLDTTLAPTEFGVQLTALFGVSIPMIVRRGELEASVSLGDLSLGQGKDSAHMPILSMVFTRTGSESVYGDIKVKFHPVGGGEVELAMLKGVAVYTPNTTRTLQLQLAVPESLRLANGRMTVEYMGRNELKSTPLAISELKL